MKYVDNDSRTLSEIMVDEVYYASKFVGSIKSGFSRLQYRNIDGDWCDLINHDIRPTDMYYVCALFLNYTHIPITMLIPRYPECGGRPLSDDELILEPHLINIAIQRGHIDYPITCCAEAVRFMYEEVLCIHTDDPRYKYEIQFLNDAKAWIEHIVAKRGTGMVNRARRTSYRGDGIEYPVRVEAPLDPLLMTRR